MHSFDQINGIINDTFSNLRFNKEPKNLYAPIDYIMNLGGKRVRPLLTLAGCNVFTDDITPAINPSVAVEIFHNFTLVHDDIMDKADIRRGKTTIHKKWDENIAILSGDAMTIIAYQYLSSASAKHLPKILDIFNSLALGICEGQQYDMDFERRTDVTRDEYLRMIELKTSILLKGALQIGAVIGDAIDDDIQNIGEFGRCLGIAFQLQDDLLDTYGDTGTFGKNIGGDIVSNKKTILTIETLSSLNADTKEKFISIMSDKNLERQKKIDSITAIYNTVNIKEKIDCLVRKYFDEAISSLNKINVPDRRKVVLHEIADRLMKRNS